jgi:hypothetical protein
MDNGNVIERQKNILHAESLLNEALTTAVRGLLPVKQILKDYMGEDMEDDVPEVSEPVVDATPKVLEAPEKQDAPEAPDVPKKQEAPEKQDAPDVPKKQEAPEKQEAQEALEKQEEQVKIEKLDVAEEPKQEGAGEPSVTFSEYDEVFDVDQPPEMRHVRTNTIDEGILQVDETSSAPVSADDIEDLDPPTTTIVEESIQDNEVVCLE